jgi:hypothetical protein
VDIHEEMACFWLASDSTFSVFVQNPLSPLSAPARHSHSLTAALATIAAVPAVPAVEAVEAVEAAGAPVPCLPPKLDFTGSLGTRLVLRPTF